MAHTKFQTEGGKVHSADGLRQAIPLARWGTPETREVLSANPEVVDDWVGSVAVHLRDRLSGYIDVSTDRIGHSFPVVADELVHIRATPDRALEIHSSSSVSGLAKGLIRAAAVLGADRAAELVSVWAGGEPRHYTICVVLAGVYIDEGIELDEGLRMYRLPVSSDSLPISMPDLRWELVADILGHAVLEVDASTHSALFVPRQSADAHPPLQTCTALSEVSLDTFFLALSLVCNRRVGSAWSWNDFGDASAFTTGRRIGLAGPGLAIKRLSKDVTHSLYTGVTKLSSFDPPTLNLCRKGLQRAWTLSSELQRRLDSDERFQTAVTRWTEAATPGVLNPDRLIDLRIALESLYLDSNDGELGFRLSVTGARHLGASLEERRARRKTLVDFYGLASRVIHGATLAKKADVALVDRATKLCRDGILKIVERRDQPSWTDFLLS